MATTPNTEAAILARLIQAQPEELPRSKAEEEKMASYEKTEAGGKEYSDLRVSRVKMISENCTQ